MTKKQLFHRLAQFLLFYTLLVILWGAWVRISHSGDGCGVSWPLCQGQFIPTNVQKKTWVEFSHRITSGLFGIYVFAMFLWGRRLFAKTDFLRKALNATLFFTITEALLGAKLVLFGLVGNNDSWWRVFAMGLHQANSILLTASVATLVLYAGKLPGEIKSLELQASPYKVVKNSKWFLILFVLIPVTGTFAALSSTLFPSTTLWGGISDDFSVDAHYLLRLRIAHPILATLIGGGFALYFWMQSQQEKNKFVQKSELQVALIFMVAVVFGYITLFSLAPVWMKIVHLLIAHLICIALWRWYQIKKLTR